MCHDIYPARPITTVYLAANTYCMMDDLRSRAMSTRVQISGHYTASGYRHLCDSDTDRRKILHDGTYRSQTESLPYRGSTTSGTPKS